MLFAVSNILKHNAGEGEAAFDWRSKVPANQRAAAGVNQKSESLECEQSLFIEPVRWMGESIKDMEGKVSLL